MFTVAGLMYLIHKCLQYTLKKSERQRRSHTNLNYHLAYSAADVEIPAPVVRNEEPPSYFDIISDEFQNLTKNANNNSNARNDSPVDSSSKASTVLPAYTPTPAPRIKSAPKSEEKYVRKSEHIVCREEDLENFYEIPLASSTLLPHSENNNNIQRERGGFRNRGSFSVPSYSFKFTRGSQVKKINSQNAVVNHQMVQNVAEKNNIENDLNLPFYFQNNNDENANETVSSHIVKPLDDNRVGQNSKRFKNPPIQAKRLMNNQSHLWVIPKRRNMDNSYEKQNLMSVSAKIQAKIQKQQKMSPEKRQEQIPPVLYTESDAVYV